MSISFGDGTNVTAKHRQQIQMFWYMLTMHKECLSREGVSNSKLYQISLIKTQWNEMEDSPVSLPFGFSFIIIIIIPMCARFLSHHCRWFCFGLIRHWLAHGNFCGKRFPLVDPVPEFVILCSLFFNLIGPSGTFFGDNEVHANYINDWDECDVVAQEKWFFLQFYLPVMSVSRLTNFCTPQERRIRVDVEIVFPLSLNKHNYEMWKNNKSFWKKEISWFK